MKHARHSSNRNTAAVSLVLERSVAWSLLDAVRTLRSLCCGPAQLWRQNPRDLPAGVILLDWWITPRSATSISSTENPSNHTHDTA